MLDKDVKYCLNDKCIVPAIITSIESRSECYPYYISDNIVMLPIFAAPMNCVTDATNYNTWVEHGIQAIMPRTVPWETRCWSAENGRWVAMSQKEFYNYFVSDARILRGPGQTYRICIDTANAHRQSIYEMSKLAKQLANNEYDIKIMVGNIANPETYKYITAAYPNVIDYIRISIGTGSGCITSTQLSVHYPEASLIEECAKYKNMHGAPNIIADGGMRTNANIMVALALGADYVMIGSMLAAFDESCAPWEKDEETGKVTRLYYGMSTKKAQKLMNAAAQNPIPEDKLNLKTSEGTFKHLEPQGKISKWTDNLQSYIRSTMSYCDCRTLEEFTSGKVKVITKSPATTNAINK